MSVRVMCGDAIERLRELSDGSVHCCITSPPYWGLRDYGVEGQIGLEPTPEAWAARLVGVFREVRRVLRPDGVCFVNCGSSYVSGGTRPSQSRPPERAPACDSDGTALVDCSAPGSACSGRDGERQAGSPSHHDHTLCNDQRHQPDASPPAPTDRDSEPLDCVPTAVGSSLACVQASTIQASSPSALGASYPACAVVDPSGVPTSEPATPANAHRASCKPDTPASELPSGCRTGNGPSSSAWIDPSCSGCGVCWSYLAIPRLQLKAKDLLMQAHLLAMALQADGWYCRAEIIWGKPNPLPESVTDRPTKAHEQVFLLTKAPRYFWDQEAVREAAEYGRREQPNGHLRPWGNLDQHQGERTVSGRNPETGRNLRSVWQIATEPFSESHFAVFPRELVRRCILAGTSAKGCCPPGCGAPWARVVERDGADLRDDHLGRERIRNIGGRVDGYTRLPAGGVVNGRSETTGWRPTCTCNKSPSPEAVNGSSEVGPGHGVCVSDASSGVNPSPLDPIPCTVLDCFAGSGTTGVVADELGRDAILIELSPVFAKMCERRVAKARARRMLGDAPRHEPLPGQLGLF